MDGSRAPGERASHNLLNNVDRAKRRMTPTACERCRRKKTKCDGGRPCGECSHRGTDCVYHTRENETARQAAKRKHSELAQSQYDLQQIYQTLAGSNERRATEVFRLIRAGSDVSAIVKELENADLRQESAQSYEEKLRRDFIIALGQSTAPLQDILDLAGSILNRRMETKIVGDDIFLPHKDRVIELETLNTLLSRASARQQPPEAEEDVSEPSTFEPIEDGSYDGPLFWVPASPWTDITNDDYTVSHLVSLYLTHFNPYWRCVEEDLFLRAIRSRLPTAEYCSPFLVNAILALTSQISEIEGAFVEPGQLITRGAHFHKEAIRLWDLEEGHASITNMQALAILSLESSLRGKDKVGFTFIASAAALNDTLAIPDPLPSMDRSMFHYIRARRCIAWTIMHVDILFTLGLFHPSNVAIEKINNVPDLSILPDSTVYWTGYPMRREPVPLKLNLLAQERCTMTRFAIEIADLLLFKKETEPPQKLLKAVKVLGGRMSQWYEQLPVELRYKRRMPTALFDFHGEYCSWQMILSCQAYAAIFGTTIEPSDATDKIPEQRSAKLDLHKSTMKYAYTAATLARDFREVYGLKVVAAFVMQTAAVASFVLLRDMQLHPLPPDSSPTRSAPDADINDTQGGFEECFRFLMGSGLQIMLPRGIARMIRHTADFLQVQLPQVVQQMLHMVAESAWHPSDVHQLSSAYPNWAILDQKTNGHEQSRMEDMLREWETLKIRDRPLTEE